MSTEPKKQRDTTGPLEPAIAATRMAKVLKGAPARIAKREAELLQERLAIQGELGALKERCTDATKLRALLVALEVDPAVALENGIVLEERPADVPNPHAEPEPPPGAVPDLPKGAQPLPPERESRINGLTGGQGGRRTGAARTRGTEAP